MEKIINFNPNKISFLFCRTGIGGSIEYYSIVKPNAVSSCYSENVWLMLIKVFTHLSKFYQPDGSYNLEATEIEKYALCLYHDGLAEETVKIFNGIFGDSIDRLYTKRDACNRFESLSLEPGKLGYEGLLCYSKACLSLGLKDKAFRLLLELVTKIPANSSPYRVLSVRVEALEIMLKIKKSVKIKKLLDEAKKYRH